MRKSGNLVERMISETEEKIRLLTEIMGLMLEEDWELCLCKGTMGKDIAPLALEELKIACSARLRVLGHDLDYWKTKEPQKGAE